MRYSELAENKGRPLVIDIGHDYGSVEGYVVDSNLDQLDNWLEKHGLPDELASTIRGKYAKIAMLNNINVDDDHKGQGHGNDLFYDFQNEAVSEGAQAILLIADTVETQNEGFDLVSWYVGLGFEKVAETGSGPFMICEI